MKTKEVCPFCESELSYVILQNYDGVKKPVAQALCERCGARGPLKLNSNEAFNAFAKVIKPKKPKQRVTK